LDQKDYRTYFTVVSGWRRFQPLRWNIFKRRDPITIASRVRGGTIIEMGSTKEIPISDLFFSGGATSVRGYQEQLLGPATLDENGYKDKAIGGKLLFVANAELRIPLFWLFVGEVFFDMGNVWRELKDFDLREIKTTTGIGIAILTPVGPIRFDYGIKLNPDSTDKERDAFHFGLYFAF
jgi:outer membrane protein insertion porin family